MLRNKAIFLPYMVAQSYSARWEFKENSVVVTTMAPNQTRKIEIDGGKMSCDVTGCADHFHDILLSFLGRLIEADREAT